MGIHSARDSFSPKKLKLPGAGSVIFRNLIICALSYGAARHYLNLLKIENRVVRH